MADETHSEAVNNDDLFGASTTAVAEPEQETGSEEPSGEVTEEVATEPTEEAEVAETEEQTASEADQPPTDPTLDAFLAKKQFSRDEFDELLERYGLTHQELAANAKLKFLVWDKYNADKKIAEKPTEQKTAEPAKQDQPVVAANPLDHVKSTIQGVTQYNDPAVLKAYVDEFSAAGEKGDAVAQFQVLAAAANNLFETRFEAQLQSKLEQVLEKALPGFVGNYKSYQRGQEAMNVWSEMRQENQNLPESFAALEQAALKQMPSLGKVEMPLRERLDAYVALSAGQKVDPAVTEKVAEKTVQKKLEVKKTADAAKGLGAGKSNGAMNQKAKGNDDIFGAPGEYPINQRLIGKNP